MQAWLGPQAAQSSTNAHWLAGTHCPDQQSPFTNGTNPGWQIGVGLAQATFEPSQSKPAMQWPAWQSTVTLTWSCVQRVPVAPHCWLHIGVICVFGSASQLQQSSTSLQSLADAHSAIAIPPPVLELDVPVPVDEELPVPVPVEDEVPVPVDVAPVDEDVVAEAPPEPPLPPLSPQPAKKGAAKKSDVVIEATTGVLRREFMTHLEVKDRERVTRRARIPASPKAR
jgi:hypothetical protein